MKRVGGLIEQIANRRNVAEGAWRASAGKRDVPEVRTFFGNFDNELDGIVCLLAEGRYAFSEYRQFSVRDTKSREIHAPRFRDRVVHHALVNVCGPLFQRGAIFHSYACRKGKGQHAALARARLWARGSEWYGKMDVRKFYDSVDHECLKALLRRRFRESRLLRQFDRLIDSFSARSGKGIPIGALSSQYFGNFYLDELDKRMVASGKMAGYLRYMDDILVFGNRGQMQQTRELAVQTLNELELDLKNGGEWNRCSAGIPFLGFVVYPNRIRLGKAGRKRLRCKTRVLQRRWKSGEVSDKELQSKGDALFAHARWGDDAAWRRAALATWEFSKYSGEMQEAEPRDAGRLLEQQGREVPFRQSQQEEAGQPQQESGFPSGLVSRHEGRWPTDDVSSRSRIRRVLDETSDKPTAGVDIFEAENNGRIEEKRPAVAPDCEQKGPENG